MIPQFQLETNNCFSACLASILDMDQRFIPNFFEYSFKSRMSAVDYWRDAIAWCKSQGVWIKMLHRNHILLDDCIGIYKIPKSSGSHAVIMRNNEPWFDPGGDGFDVSKWNKKSPLCKVAICRLVA